MRPPVLIVLLFLGNVTLADSHVDDRFSLSLGVFVTDHDTDTRLDGDLTVGTDINFEKALNLDASDTVFRVDGYYRFNEKHRIDFSVFDLSRDVSNPINRDIQWGDDLFTIDTVVNLDVDFNIYKLAYTYGFFRRPKGYIGAIGGFYVADTSLTIEEANTGRAAVGDVTAPLPVIGLRGQYDLSDKWSFRASGEFFFIDYNDIEGSLVDLFAGIDYQIFDSAALGIAVNSVTIDIDADKSSFAGAINWRYVGGLLYLKFDF